MAAAVAAAGVASAVVAGAAAAGSASAVVAGATGSELFVSVSGFCSEAML